MRNCFLARGNIFDKAVRFLTLQSFFSVFAAKCFTMSRTLPKYAMQLCSRPCVQCLRKWLNYTQNHVLNNVSYAFGNINLTFF